MIGIRPSVADAVVVHDETVLNVVIYAVIGGGAQTVRRPPLPCEADKSCGGRVGVGRPLVQNCRTPRIAVPRLNSIAGTSVIYALDSHVLWRREGVGA